MALKLSNTSKIYVSKGSLYRKTGKEILAIKNYKRAVEKDSKNMDAYEGLIKSYMDIRAFGAADKYCDIFIKKFQDSYKGDIIKSEIYSLGEELGEAIEICDKGIEQFSKCSKLYKERGEVKAKLEKYEEAIIDFDKAIKLESDKREIADIYFNKGLCYENKRDYDNAIIYYKKAAEENMNDSSDFIKELSADAYEKLEELYNIKSDMKNYENCKETRKELEVYKKLIMKEE